VFAASFLITKHLTRTEKPGVIVMWQSITVTLFSLPLALMNWQAPTLFQWGGFMVAGVLGTIGHYSLTKAFSVADISATQSLRFLDLVWASLLGWLVFGDFPSQWTWLGAAVILVSTVWIARREGRRKEEPSPLNPSETRSSGVSVTRWCVAWGRVANATGHVACWHMLRCRFNVTRLIVKEKVGLKFFEKFTLGQAA
jgi:uncharacterized membrane protein